MANSMEQPMHAKNAPDGGRVNAGRAAPRLPVNAGVKPEHWGEDEPDMPLLRGPGK